MSLLSLKDYPECNGTSDYRLTCEIKSINLLQFDS